MIVKGHAVFGVLTILREVCSYYDVNFAREDFTDESCSSDSQMAKNLTFKGRWSLSNL